MQLDDSKVLPGGLFHFRVIVSVRLIEPIVLEGDAYGEAEELVGYYRTYGVTAASPSAAIAMVERHHEDGSNATDGDDPAGTVEDIEISVVDPAEIEEPGGSTALAEAGIHLQTGRSFYPADDDSLEDLGPA